MEINKLYCIDNVEGMKKLPDNFVDLTITSPPYADMRKYETFSGIHPDKYVEWFLPISSEILRIAKPSGSFILNINDKVVNGFRHTFVFSLVLEMEKQGWGLYDRLFWVKRNPMPGKRGGRCRDATEYLFWFSKTNRPKIRIDSVKHPKKDTKDRTNELYGTYRSGHNTKKRETSQRFPDMVTPLNILEVPLGNQYKSAGSHVAVYPERLPEFFIKYLTDPNDIVFDPFVGSGTTAKIAKVLGRKYLGFDVSQKYIDIANKRISE